MSCDELKNYLIRQIDREICNDLAKMVEHFSAVKEAPLPMIGDEHPDTIDAPLTTMKEGDKVASIVHDDVATITEIENGVAYLEWE